VLLYIVCNTYIFGANIYRCLVSCIINIIHAECRNILNLLYSHVEFSFWFGNDHFLYTALELVYSMQNFILVIGLLISVLNCSE
jgi:hypothetical protein